MVKNLRQLRCKRGISQQQLAETIGFSQQAINKYENHKIEPDIETLIKLADFFDTSVDYLIGHTEIDHVIEPVNRFDLSTDEAQLIDNYRMLSKKQKSTVSMVVESFNE